MLAMPALDVRANDAHEYVATVTAEDGTQREYTVRVSRELLDRLSLQPSDEPHLVRHALELMLARPGGHMPERFDLAHAERAYPGLEAELATLVGRPDPEEGEQPMTGASSAEPRL